MNPPAAAATSLEERLDAIELLLSHLLRAIEGDSVSIREKAARLESAILAIAPDKLPEPGDEEHFEVPFTLESFRLGLRAHTVATARQVALIESIAARVLR